jgi:hypothetical protein
MDEEEAQILPWRSRSPQEEGIHQEKRWAKRNNKRRHPASGAGHIKNDCSDDEELVEIKTAKSTHTVNVKDIEALYRRGVQQRKRTTYVIRFENGLMIEGNVRMDV